MSDDDKTLVRQVADLRVENERLRLAQTACENGAWWREKAERAEAEVERLRFALETVREQEAQRRSLQITDEVVDRAAVAFRAEVPCTLADARRGVRVALEAVWPAQGATDCRVSSTPSGVEITPSMRAEARARRELEKKLGGGDYEPVQEPHRKGHDDFQLWPFGLIDERDDDS